MKWLAVLLLVAIAIDGLPALQLRKEAHTRIPNGIGKKPAENSASLEVEISKKKDVNLTKTTAREANSPHGQNNHATTKAQELRKHEDTSSDTGKEPTGHSAGLEVEISKKKDVTLTKTTAREANSPHGQNNHATTKALQLRKEAHTRIPNGVGKKSTENSASLEVEISKKKDVTLTKTTAWEANSPQGQNNHATTKALELGKEAHTHIPNGVGKKPTRHSERLEVNISKEKNVTVNKDTPRKETSRLQNNHARQKGQGGSRRRRPSKDINRNNKRGGVGGSEGKKKSSNRSPEGHSHTNNNDDGHHSRHALKLGKDVQTSSGTGKNTNKHSVGLEVGISKEKDFSGTKNTPREKNPSAHNKQNTHARTKDQGGSQTDTDSLRSRPKYMEQNNKKENFQQLGEGGSEGGLLRKKQTLNLSRDKHSHTNKNDKDHHRHRIHESADQDDSPRRRKSMRRSRGGNRKSKTPSSGGRHKSKTRPSKATKVSSQPSYKTQGQRTRGIDNQGLLNSGGNQDDSGQYGIKKIIGSPSTLINFERDYQRPTFHTPNHSSSGPYLNDNYGSENGKYATGSHGPYLAGVTGFRGSAEDKNKSHGRDTSELPDENEENFKVESNTEDQGPNFEDFDKENIAGDTAGYPRSASTDNTKKYRPGNGNGSNSNNYLNAYNHGRGAVNYPRTASQGSGPGKFLNGDFVQGGSNAGLYTFADKDVHKARRDIIIDRYRGTDGDGVSRNLHKDPIDQTMHRNSWNHGKSDNGEVDTTSTKTVTGDIEKAGGTGKEDDGTKKKGKLIAIDHNTADKDAKYKIEKLDQIKKVSGQDVRLDKNDYDKTTENTKPVTEKNVTIRYTGKDTGKKDNLVEFEKSVTTTNDSGNEDCDYSDNGTDKPESGGKMKRHGPIRKGINGSGQNDGLDSKNKTIKNIKPKTENSTTTKDTYEDGKDTDKKHKKVEFEKSVTNKDKIVIVSTHNDGSSNEDCDDTNNVNQSIENSKKGKTRDSIIWNDDDDDDDDQPGKPKIYGENANDSGNEDCDYSDNGTGKPESGGKMIRYGPIHKGITRSRQNDGLDSKNKTTKNIEPKTENTTTTKDTYEDEKDTDKKRKKVEFEKSVTNKDKIVIVSTHNDGSSNEDCDDTNNVNQSIENSKKGKTRDSIIWNDGDDDDDDQPGKPKIYGENANDSGTEDCDYSDNGTGKPESGGKMKRYGPIHKGITRSGQNDGLDSKNKTTKNIEPKTENSTTTKDTYEDEKDTDKKRKKVEFEKSVTNKDKIVIVSTHNDGSSNEDCDDTNNVNQSIENSKKGKTRDSIIWNDGDDDDDDQPGKPKIYGENANDSGNEDCDYSDNGTGKPESGGKMKRYGPIHKGITRSGQNDGLDSKNKTTKNIEPKTENTTTTKDTYEDEKDTDKKHKKVEFEKSVTNKDKIVIVSTHNDGSSNEDCDDTNNVNQSIENSKKGKTRDSIIWNDDDDDDDDQPGKPKIYGENANDSGNEDCDYSDNGTGKPESGGKMKRYGPIHKGITRSGQNDGLDSKNKTIKNIKPKTENTTTTKDTYEDGKDTDKKHKKVEFEKSVTNKDKIVIVSTHNDGSSNEDCDDTNNVNQSIENSKKGKTRDSIIWNDDDDDDDDQPGKPKINGENANDSGNEDCDYSDNGTGKPESGGKMKRYGPIHKGITRSGQNDGLDSKNKTTKNIEPKTENTTTTKDTYEDEKDTDKKRKKVEFEKSVTNKDKIVIVSTHNDGSSNEDCDDTNNVNQSIENSKKGKTRDSIIWNDGDDDDDDQPGKPKIYGENANDSGNEDCDYSDNGTGKPESGGKIKRYGPIHKGITRSRQSDGLDSKNKNTKNIKPKTENTTTTKATYEDEKDTDKKHKKVEFEKSVTNKDKIVIVSTHNDGSSNEDCDDTNNVNQSIENSKKGKTRDSIIWNDDDDDDDDQPGKPKIYGENANDSGNEDCDYSDNGTGKPESGGKMKRYGPIHKGITRSGQSDGLDSKNKNTKNIKPKTENTTTTKATYEDEKDTDKKRKKVEFEKSVTNKDKIVIVSTHNDGSSNEDCDDTNNVNQSIENSKKGKTRDSIIWNDDDDDDDDQPGKPKIYGENANDSGNEDCDYSDNGTGKPESGGKMKRYGPIYKGITRSGQNDGLDSKNKTTKNIEPKTENTTTTKDTYEDEKDTDKKHKKVEFEKSVTNKDKIVIVSTHNDGSSNEDCDDTNNVNQSIENSKKGKTRDSIIWNDGDDDDDDQPGKPKIYGENANDSGNEDCDYSDNGTGKPESGGKMKRYGPIHKGITRSGQNDGLDSKNKTTKNIEPKTENTTTTKDTYEDEKDTDKKHKKVEFEKSVTNKDKIVIVSTHNDGSSNEDCDDTNNVNQSIENSKKGKTRDSIIWNDGDDDDDDQPGKPKIYGENANDSGNEDCDYSDNGTGKPESGGKMKRYGPIHKGITRSGQNDGLDSKNKNTKNIKPKTENTTTTKATYEDEKDTDKKHKKVEFEKSVTNKDKIVIVSTHNDGSSNEDCDDTNNVNQSIENSKKGKTRDSIIWNDDDDDDDDQPGKPKIYGENANDSGNEDCDYSDNGTGKPESGGKMKRYGPIHKGINENTSPKKEEAINKSRNDNDSVSNIASKYGRGKEKGATESNSENIDTDEKSVARNDTYTHRTRIVKPSQLNNGHDDFCDEKDQETRKISDSTKQTVSENTSENGSEDNDNGSNNDKTNKLTEVKKKNSSTASSDHVEAKGQRSTTVNAYTNAGLNTKPNSRKDNASGIRHSLSKLARILIKIVPIGSKKANEDESNFAGDKMTTDSTSVKPTGTEDGQGKTQDNKGAENCGEEKIKQVKDQTSVFSISSTGNNNNGESYNKKSNDDKNSEGYKERRKISSTAEGKKAQESSSSESSNNNDGKTYSKSKDDKNSRGFKKRTKESSSRAYNKKAQVSSSSESKTDGNSSEIKSISSNKPADDC